MPSTVGGGVRDDVMNLHPASAHRKLRGEMGSNTVLARHSSVLTTVARSSR